MLMYMDMHLYIWKENQSDLKDIEEPNALINKLLKIYFEKKRKENANL